MSHELLTRPWEKVGTDLFEFKNKNYLITVDYYSSFWEVDKLPDTKAKTVILKLKSHFARYRCPDKVVSDNVMNSQRVLKPGNSSTAPSALETARRTERSNLL